ncbi:hypothetical protein FD27_GL000559 [Limosilactobacillus frumenti DSM 13145]|uniref:Uncharacterized protein n=1 Tax=Limosilactobacillus frumenti DSM 13145 TaxID=1423746 RepID=A0A0R1PDU0_9LACO|nr:hypothetical protein [Limosilactobacillus frumenti]KRL27818.1 hypothetical protein FD27_GL000559 [Limosilactobacillus frumenti DSM 13145]MBA2914310.1 hypothetical protein [Limosilactobacillus frumenti]QFG73367.1 hypothetical protein LF145_08640 [Limosilactobacillus frumenti]
MKINDLHNQVKENYENGNYTDSKDTSYYTAPDEITKNKRILRVIEPVSLILLILSIYRGLHISNWIRWVILILFICNALAVIYFSVKVIQSEKNSKQK